MFGSTDPTLLTIERIAVIVAAVAALIPIGIYIYEIEDRRVGWELQKAQAIEYCTEKKLIDLVKPIIDELSQGRSPDNTTADDRELIRSRIETTPLNEILKICAKVGYPEPEMIKALRQ
jgi:hypothetical protein